MSCQTCQFEIEELGTSERLSDDARAHVSVCRTCRAFHEERQALKRLIGDLEPVSAPSDFDFRLRARLAAAKDAGSHRSSLRSFLASAPALAMAASFALLVAGFVFYNQVRSGSSPGPQAGEVASQQSIEKPEEGATSNASTGAAIEVSPQIPQTITKGSEAINEGSQKPRPQLAAKAGGRRQPKPSNLNVEPRISNDFALNPAPVITPAGSALSNAQMNPVVEFPIRSASQPMRVLIDDPKGATRKVTLEPVIFGSQDLTGRNTSHLATSQGIW